MGNANSIQEKGFINEFSVIQDPNFKDYASLIKSAGQLYDTDFINPEIVLKVYYENPKNLRILVMQAIKFLNASYSFELNQGSLFLLDKIFFILFCSYHDVRELSWLLFPKSNPLKIMFQNLYGSLLKAGFFNPHTFENGQLWDWSQTYPVIEKSRSILMYYVFLANIPEVFFDNQDVIKHFISCTEMSEEIAEKFYSSILPVFSIEHNDIETTILSFLTILAINHKSFSSVIIRKTSISEPVSENLLYIAVEQLFSEAHLSNLIFKTPSPIEKTRFNLLLFSYVSILINQSAVYNVSHLFIVLLRLLQLSNEKGIQTSIHRITLILLDLISAEPSNYNTLSEPLSKSISTRYSFSKKSPISQAAFIAAANTIIGRFIDYIPVAISVLHNLSIIIDYDKNITNVIAECFKTVFLIAKESSSGSNSDESRGNIENLFVVLERYVNGAGDNDSKRASLKKLMEKISNEIGIDGFMKERIFATIDSCGTDHSYPLLIEDINDHLDWARTALINLFRKSNKITLERLKSTCEEIQRPENFNPIQIPSELNKNKPSPQKTENTREKCDDDQLDHEISQKDKEGTEEEEQKE